VSFCWHRVTYLATTNFGDSDFISGSSKLIESHPFAEVLRKVSPRVTLKVACAQQMLLPAAGGIYAGKSQKVDHAKALRRSVMSGQRRYPIGLHT
jgi:hypothetical protein